jgi:uncharacterized protein Usg
VDKKESHYGLTDSVGLLKNHLVTAEIIYRLPDYPLLVQTYVWQDVDYVPELPRFKQFLEYWKNNLEGRLRQVRWTSQPLIYEHELSYSRYLN